MDKSKKEKQARSWKIFKKKVYPYINSSIQTTTEDTRSNKTHALKKCTKTKTNNKKQNRGNSQKSNSITHLHQITNVNVNSRYFTESYPNACANHQSFLKKKAEKSIMSPRNKILVKDNSGKTRDRLSLSVCKKRNNNSEGKDTESTQKNGGVWLTELQKQRGDIQKHIKNMMKKQKIQKKQVLKITQKYQKLIDRIAFSQMLANPPIQQFDTKYFVGSNYSPSSCCQDINSIPAVQEIKGNSVQKSSSKPNLCPGIQLSKLKKLQIQDYNDQFMSHYDELSQSWKRQIAAQRRY